MIAYADAQASIENQIYSRKRRDVANEIEMSSKILDHNQPLPSEVGTLGQIPDSLSLDDSSGLNVRFRDDSIVRRKRTVIPDSGRSNPKKKNKYRRFSNGL